MWFLRDIVLPIALALILLSLIVFIIHSVLKFFTLDIPIIKVAGLIGVWYYLGPIVYEWLMTKIVVVPREGIRVLYMPIHVIIETVKKLA